VTKTVFFGFEGRLSSSM